MPKRSVQLSSAIQDSHLVFNDSRKTLFAGKTFVFMTKKHFDMYSPIVLKAGGQCKDLKNNVPKAFLVRKNTIVVQYVASTQSQGTQTINTLSEYLESKSLRTIPEYEIGLAIVCCTTEKYCNPAFSTISNILPGSTTQTPNIGTMLAENTGSQKSEINSSDFASSDIPESSNYLKNKSGPKQPLRSEVYDSEIISIESQNSMEALSMIPESDSSFKSKETNEKTIQKQINNLNFSDEEFSENLILSSDMVSNETPQSSETRKRPTTPLANAEPMTKKPRITTPLVSENRQDETEPVRSSAGPSKRNAPQSRLILPGFLQKSQIASTQREAILEESQQSLNRSSAPAKRGRIALLNDNDSDDNDDDIFNFGSSPKKSKPSDGEERVGRRACDSDEEELFAFGGGNKSPSDEVDRVERQHHNDGDIRTVQPCDGNKKSPTNTSYVRSKIKVVPIKAEPEGWLSALSILKIKTDDEEVKDEKNCSEDDLKRKEWVDSLKDGFEVRVRKMNLLSKISNCSIAQETSNTSLNTTKKNFKAFVKKHNYKSQTQIIPTFKTVVPPT